jgi:acetyl-CoA carboxylase / biotin carboxylase 1
MSTYDHSRVQQFIGTRLQLFGLYHCLPVPGGNSLDVAPASSVHDFVKKHGGHTVITKVRYWQSLVQAHCQLFIGPHR